MWWLWIVAAVVFVAVIIAWVFIFRAAMRDRNDHGEFTYRDVYG